MKNYRFACRAKKIVTVSGKGTIKDGVIIINNDKIENIGTYNELKNKLNDIPIYDYSEKVITPSLIDCHCHLLEYAPASLYPVTKETYLEAGKILLFNALLSGITAIGEQICGSPICDISIDDYMQIAKYSPIRINFSLNAITIGTKDLPNYTCLHESEQVDKNILSDIQIVSKIATKNEYPGENVFINATPANLPTPSVPRAGEIIFTEKELKSIVDTFHNKNKKIGEHVARYEGIDLALRCGIDILHHSHGINDEQIKIARNNNISIVATPLVGMSADFLVSDGVPGLDITDSNQISAIFVNGKKLISR